MEKFYMLNRKKKKKKEEILEGKVGVWEVYINSGEKKKSKRQGRKGKITQLSAEFQRMQSARPFKWTKKRIRGKQ